MKKTMLLAAMLPSIGVCAGFSATVKLRSLEDGFLPGSNVLLMDVVNSDIREFAECSSVTVRSSYSFFRWKIQRSSDNSPKYREHKQAIDMLKRTSVAQEFKFTVRGQGLLNEGACIFKSEGFAWIQSDKTFEITSFYLTN